MTRIYKRVLLETLPQAESEGWHPTTTAGGAVGTDPFAGGTQQSVLVEREAEAGEEYSELRRVLGMAVDQAAVGKGKERHASDGEAFDEQPIVRFNLWLGSNHGDIFQACKKATESTRLPRDRAIAELLGAINYLAAAVLVLERLEE